MQVQENAAATLRDDDGAPANAEQPAEQTGDAEGDAETANIAAESE
jgi:hypothetical protein